MGVDPGWQAVPLQQPELQGAVLEQVEPHCREAPHDSPPEQSAGPEQPQPELRSGRVTQAWPDAEAVQMAQACPDDPQARAAFPTTQFVPSQQPPLHDRPPVQEVEQVWLVALQAWPEGQSELRLQPQAPWTQACPAALLVQLAQLAPGAPQAAMAVPGWQAPEASQHPPAQGAVPEQAPEHFFDTGSHAWPFGQSPEVEQPQAPERQACPAAAAVQSAQVAPAEPQVAAAVPAEHSPLAQQPPLQVSPPAQDVEQDRVVGLHA